MRMEPRRLTPIECVSCGLRVRGTRPSMATDSFARGGMYLSPKARQETTSIEEILGRPPTQAERQPARPAISQARARLVVHGIDAIADATGLPRPAALRLIASAMRITPGIIAQWELRGLSNSRMHRWIATIEWIERKCRLNAA